MERKEYAGWPNCCYLANGEVELCVTTDVGPRVIHFGFVGGPNEFAVFEDQAGLVGGDEWRIYGGHRLWHSPEAKPRSYFPDNDPVEATEIDGGLRLTPPVETTTGIQKQIDLSLDPEEARVRLVHRLRNDGMWSVELAAWALSVMAPGGMGMVPHPQGDPEALLPNRVLTLWPYTDMEDARVRWGTKLIRIRQDSGAEKPVKIGLSATDGWAAYLHEDRLFLKQFDYAEGAAYPDSGCSVEIYTNSDMMEVETVGPLTRLDPGDELEHVETWQLFRGVQAPDDEDGILAAIAGRL